MKISNETIKKLTVKELNDLGCGIIGIYTYKGQLKTRTKGFKRVQLDEKEFYFTSDDGMVQFVFIKTADETEVEQWAVRRACMTNNDNIMHYEESWQVLWGCSFFK